MIAAESTHCLPGVSEEDSVSSADLARGFGRRCFDRCSSPMWLQGENVDEHEEQGIEAERSRESQVLCVEDKNQR